MPRPDRRPRPQILLLFLAWLGVLLAGCSQLPTLDDRTVSTAMVETGDTRLATAMRPLLEAHPGLSGIVPLVDGHDAFAARAALADAAERTLDIQYYIWHDDLSGALLFDAVRGAADRGVRVRLLLDDNNTSGLDEVLRALDAHPNVEVRLFNPFMNRNWRLVDYLTDFRRLNRRMHNKSFTADNQVTVIGGRNIGDQYFAAGRDLLFVDMDVLAVGPVAADVAQDFDRYWSSGSSYPVDRVLPPDPVVRPHRSGIAIAGEDAARAYREAIANSSFGRDLLARRLPWQWARTWIVSDDPAKGLGRAAQADLFPARLREVMGGLPSREMQVVSSYFVPTERGTAFFSELARNGVEVSVLTNALEATDVPAVHAGYAKWRKPLLEAGVHLYELKRIAPVSPARGSGVPGSSTSSLHAKTFMVDRSRIFVGSFNFDPRSARLNTELGFVIDSPALASRMADGFATAVPQRAYRLRLEGSRLQWVEQRADGATVHDHEPNTSALRRFGVWLLSLLPIDELL